MQNVISTLDITIKYALPIAAFIMSGYAIYRTKPRIKLSHKAYWLSENHLLIQMEFINNTPSVANVIKCSFSLDQNELPIIYAKHALNFEKKYVQLKRPPSDPFSINPYFIGSFDFLLKVDESAIGKKVSIRCRSSDKTVKTKFVIPSKTKMASHLRGFQL